MVAVDGPAASGKGTLAVRLGQALGLPVLDTGLLYRAVGVGVGPGNEEDEAACVSIAQDLDIISLDNPDLRSREAGEAASRVAVHPGVRLALLALQRRFAGRAGGAVLDGRDIGTVIAPEAAAKLFVTATPEVRAARRWRQLSDQGQSVALTDILADIRRRDARDFARAAAPLAAAADAVLLDTSDMAIDEVFDVARRIVETARARWEKSHR